MLEPVSAMWDVIGCRRKANRAFLKTNSQMEKFCDNSNCAVYRLARPGQYRHCPSCGNELCALEHDPLVWPISVLLILASVLAAVACSVRWGQ